MDRRVVVVFEIEACDAHRPVVVDALSRRALEDTFGNGRRILEQAVDPGILYGFDGKVEAYTLLQPVALAMASPDGPCRSDRPRNR